MTFDDSGWLWLTLAVLQSLLESSRVSQSKPVSAVVGQSQPTTSDTGWLWLTLADSNRLWRTARVSQSQPESSKVIQSRSDSVRVSQIVPESTWVLDRFLALADFLGPLGGPIKIFCLLKLVQNYYSGRQIVKWNIFSLSWQHFRTGHKSDSN